jgi:hypothetical protein
VQVLEHAYTVSFLLPFHILKKLEFLILFRFLITSCPPVRLAYQPPASSTFPSEQASYQKPANNTFLSEQISISHEPPAKRTVLFPYCTLRFRFFRQPPGIPLTVLFASKLPME